MYQLLIYESLTGTGQLAYSTMLFVYLFTTLNSTTGRAGISVPWPLYTVDAHLGSLGKSAHRLRECKQRRARASIRWQIDGQPKLPQ